MAAGSPPGVPTGSPPGVPTGSSPAVARPSGVVYDGPNERLVYRRDATLGTKYC